ncbi:MULTISPECIES: replication initiator [Pseudonocardia]|uniref:replication initiator n=1 Tax=Pseudonocardia TaxID=1847 RepID=UPI0027D94373|nr:replication initiator [Pseudonocardia saturnea]
MIRSSDLYRFRTHADRDSPGNFSIGSPGRRIRAAGTASRPAPPGLDDRAEIATSAVAVYPATYAMEVAEAAGHLSARLRPDTVRPYTDHATHAGRQIGACRRLGQRAVDGDPKQRATSWARLRRWAYVLDFAGRPCRDSANSDRTAQARRDRQLSHSRTGPDDAERLDRAEDTTGADRTDGGLVLTSRRRTASVARGIRYRNRSGPTTTGSTISGTGACSCWSDRRHRSCGGRGRRRDLTVSALVGECGQGRGRTADLPLFSPGSATPTHSVVSMGVAVTSANVRECSAPANDVAIHVATPLKHSAPPSRKSAVPKYRSSTQCGADTLAPRSVKGGPTPSATGGDATSWDRGVPVWAWDRCPLLVAHTHWAVHRASDLIAAIPSPTVANA